MGIATTLPELSEWTLNTSLSRQIFPEGLAKILLGISMDHILKLFGKSKQRAFRKCIPLSLSGV